MAVVTGAIRLGAVEASAEPKGISATETQIDPDEEFQEGAVPTRLHKRRERDLKASAKKQAAVLQETGKLQCEACGFDFASTCGKRSRNDDAPSRSLCSSGAESIKPLSDASHSDISQ